MRAADYPYPPDEFDAAAAGGPNGVHRRPRSSWSRWWPFLAVLVVLPALSYAAVTVASGGNPLRSAATSASSAPAAESTAPAEPTTGESSSAAETPAAVPAPAKDLSRAVEVQNSTTTSGLAARAKSVLAAAGFTTITTGNFSGTAPGTSVVYYPTAADEATATAVAAALKITTVTESATVFPGGVLAVLAGDYAP